MENSSEENLAELFTLYKEVDPDGTIRYYNKENQLHRIHGPAVIYLDGNRFWYINGNTHSRDFPAIDYNNQRSFISSSDYMHLLDVRTILDNKLTRSK